MKNKPNNKPTVQKHRENTKEAASVAASGQAVCDIDDFLGVVEVKDESPPVGPFTFVGKSTPYPSALELATLAARMFPTGDPAMACARALELIDTAEELLLFADPDPDRPDEEETTHFTFKAGAKKITNQERAGRAVDYLQDYIAARLEKRSELKTQFQKKARLNELITCWEKEGFTREAVSKLRLDYRKIKEDREK